MNNQADSLRLIVKQMKNSLQAQINNVNKGTRVITISSGKGGVGKSNLSLNLALALTDFKQKVMLLDADMGLANIDVILGLTPLYNLSHVIMGEKTIPEIIIEGPHGLKIIPGGSGMQELANLKEWELENFLTKLSKIEGEADYLLIDTGAGLAKTVLSFALAADELIIVTTSDPTAITDAYGFIKTLCIQNYSGQIYIVVNRAFSANDAAIVYNKLKIAVNKFLKYNIEFLGFVVEDSKVGQAVREQKAFIIAYPQSMASYNLYNIAAKITNQKEQLRQENGLKTFFNRVAQYFR
ncbi:MAG: MinD/ParA family protein [Clostridia bacterium]|nr:MinD/ParA family protein [Clostridia bacterium]MDD4145542.1 MinD/ParA family protein [Clostridia bacterium]MDD4664982.1 MinD/ParA family protein [Clostridia bacterium]